MEEVNYMLTVNLFRSFVIFNVLDLYHSWEAKLEVAPVVSIVWNSSRLPVPETLLDSFSREYTSLKMSQLFARLARYNLTRSFPHLIIFQYTKFRRKNPASFQPTNDYIMAS